MCVASGALSKGMVDGGGSEGSRIRYVALRE